jgi:hypothetical protein
LGKRWVMKGTVSRTAIFIASDILDVWRRASSFVDRILRGALGGKSAHEECLQATDCFETLVCRVVVAAAAKT